MKVQVDHVSDVKKKIVVTIDEDQVQSQMDEAYVDLQKNAQIPGFRKGKTPKSLLEKKYGPSVEAEVFQNLMRATMSEALEENDLDAISISDVSPPERKKGEGLTYSASLEVRPNFEPKDYKGISVKQNKEDVKDEAIQEVLDRILDNHAVMKPLDAKSPKKGQYASILVEHLDDQGNVTETPKAEEQLHMVGHESARKDVDQAIQKMSVGDTQDLTLENVPGQKDDQKTFVRLTLKSVKEKQLPELNDDFAKTVGPFENLDALKKQIKEDLSSELEDRKKVDHATQILDHLRKKNKVALPDTMLEQEMQNMRQEFFNRVVQSGQSLPEDFSADKMNEEMKPEAERRVHEQLLLTAIAKKENIEVTPQEIHAKLHELSHMYNKPEGELRAELEKSGRMDFLHYQLLSQKTLDFLVGEANMK